MIGAGLITGLAWPMLNQQSMWLPGLVISALGLGDWLFPRQLAPLWRLLEKAGQAIAHYNGIFLLSLVYILVITPAGIFFRRMRRAEAGSPAAPSFYEKPDNRGAGHMDRMF